MNVYIYDGTYDGLMTVIFEIYKSKIYPDKIVTEAQFSPLLLSHNYFTTTEKTKAQRVIRGIVQKTSEDIATSIYKAFHSGTIGIEMLVYDYVKLLLESPKGVEENYANGTVLKIKQLVRKIDHEIHRMHAFVRFQKTTDGIFFSSIEPDYNVLPLIVDFFKKRYADQKWVIYDMRRKYGIYYDTETVIQIALDKAEVNPDTGEISDTIKDEKEVLYQLLWKDYFSSVNIVERKNLKMHLQQLPKRYWKYLPEKK